MMRRWMLFVPLAIFALIGGVAAYQLSTPRDNAVKSAMIGQPVPAIELPAALGDGPPLSAATLRDGQAKLLNVWASWCLPCIAEAPQLETLKNEGIDIIGVAIGDEAEAIRRFLGEHGNPYRAIYADDYSKLQLAVGSSGIPETFVVDGNGVITYQHIGDIRERDLPKLREELAKASR